MAAAPAMPGNQRPSLVVAPAGTPAGLRLANCQGRTPYVLCGACSCMLRAAASQPAKPASQPASLALLLLVNERACVPSVHVQCKAGDGN